MAVRKYYFIVGAETLAPSMITRGGVQGEHNATEIIFKMDSSLISALNKLTAEGKTFHYRFDGYDGAGGKMPPTQPISFVPGEIDTETEFSYSLEHQLTKCGGTVQIFFVITLVDSENTEFELYAYSVKMTLKALPTGKDTKKEEYESISTLAVITKENAEKAASASVLAIEAQGKTEDARAALEGYSEWVFDGGDASGSVGIELVVDKEMSDTSSNTVQNRVIKAYIDGKKEDTDKKIKEINDNLNDVGDEISEVDKELSELKVEMVDYVVEQGEKDGGYYEKWLSGKAKYWGKKSYGDVSCGKSWHNWYETEALTLKLPEGLFIGDFPDDFDIRLLKGAAVGFANLGAIAPTTTEIKFSFSRPTATTFYDCVVGYRVIGRWKE